MTINLSLTGISGIISRSLSIIGKRSVDDQGNSLFKDITIGTNELQIINDFLINGLSDLVAELSHFMEAQFKEYIYNSVNVEWWQKNVSTDEITASDMLWYKTDTNQLFKSTLIEEDPEHEIERQASWSEITPASNTAYVTKEGVSYIWRNNLGTMERVGDGIDRLVILDLAMHSNWNTALRPTLVSTMQNYLVAYALFSWFVITAPKIAEKYQGDSMRHLSTLTRLIHEKKAPATIEEIDPFDAVKTEIT